MRCFCPLCGLPLRVHVTDVPQSMSNDEWCATLVEEDATYLHALHGEPHGDVSVIEPRSRTRRITR